MKTFVRRSGRWGVLIGVIAALSACGVEFHQGSERGPGLERTSSKEAALTAPRPEDGPRAPSSAGGAQLVAPLAPVSLEANRSVPMVNLSLHPPASPQHEEWKQDARAVAIEGEVAPGTDGQTFDAQSFAWPTVNERGNVAFAASYGGAFLPNLRTPEQPQPEGGGGVFYWNRAHDQLAPVAIAGQQTELGRLPFASQDYFELMINDRDQIAFMVNHIVQPAVQAPVTDAFAPETALFQAEPTDDKCERFDLKVIAKRGDPAPGGGEFYDFEALSENEHGDIAFIATYVYPAPALDGTVVPDAAVRPPFSEGVFLYKADCDQIVAILRGDDPLPGTGGQTVRENTTDAIRAVWMNDDRVITFQVDYFDTSSMPSSLVYGDLAGSIWIRRPGEEVKLFLAVNSPGPRLGGCDRCSDDGAGDSRIDGITARQPSVLGEHEAAYLIFVEDGMMSTSFLVTKRLDENVHGPLQICAESGDDLGRGYTADFTSPSFSSDGIMAAPALLYGWEDDQPLEARAIFSCFDGEVHLLVREGGKKPVGKDNTFGELFVESNSDRYDVFTDGDRAPTGVFTVNTNPQLP